MNRYKAALLSGFIASFLVSLILLIKIHFNFYSELHIVQKMHYAHGSWIVFFGWVIHILMGTFLWGAVYVFISPVLRGPFWLKGICFGLVNWLILMLVFLLEHIYLGHFSISLNTALTGLFWQAIYGLIFCFVHQMLPKKRVI